MSKHDGFDPLGKLLEEEKAREERIESKMSASSADKFMLRVEWGLGAALALTVGYQAYRGICAGLRCSDMGFGLPVLFAASMAGLIAIGIFRTVIGQWRDQWWRRLAVDGVAVLLIYALFLLPQQRSGEAAMAKKAEQLTIRMQEESAQQKVEAEWRTGFRARGEHGPPGAVPPALKVEQTDAGVVVTNITQKDLSVALARVRADAAAPGGWRACGMHTDGNSGGRMRFYFLSLHPGERAIYVNFAPCAVAFKDDVIEYRIGRYPGETGWWSDSAFAAPKGRESANDK